MNKLIKKIPKFLLYLVVISSAAVLLFWLQLVSLAVIFIVV